jgi:carbonic anhydrase/acetyltransferase-like protein (isoleucine patch superfamily)
MTEDIAYLQELSRHRTEMPLYNQIPQTDKAWIAPNASIIGDVMISKWASVWYGAVIRAEFHPVRIGYFSSIGDGTVILTHFALPHGLASSVNIGKNVTIEQNCSINSCIIDDDVFIGAKSMIM